MVLFSGALWRGAVIGVAMAGAVATSSFAQNTCEMSEPGCVTIYTRSGTIIHKRVGDQKMLDALTRDAMVIPNGSMIVMYNGHLYIVQDHMMPDGHLASDEALAIGGGR